MKTFDLPLRTSIVPAYAAGSATPTFTRATTATVVDHEGVLRYCRSGEARFWGARRVENLVRDTEDLTKGSWSGYGGGTFTVDTGVTDPLGGSTAFRVTTGTANGILQDLAWVYGASTYRAGEVIVASAWLRVASGTLSVNVFSQGSGGPITTITVDTTWRRWCNSGAATTVGGHQPYFILGYSGALEIWHPSLNVVTGAANVAPPEYVSSGVLSAPYHGAGADGVKYFDTANGNSVASNVVSEGTGAPIADSVLFGYLAEGQFTNRLLYSEDFSNAAWVKTNVTVTADSATSPDGATTADTLTATAANATVIQDLGVVASAQKNGALWLKRKTGSGNIQLTLDGGAGWTTVAVGADWTRFPIAQTLANEDFGVRIVTSGDEVYAWGGDVVTAAIAGAIPSYIPTTSAAGTKNADLLGYPSAGNAPTSQGTIAAQLQSKSINSGECAVTFSAGVYGAPSGLLFRKNAANQIAIGGNSSDEASAFLSGTFTPLPRKVTGQWSGVSMWVYAEANKSGIDNTLDYTGVGTTNINIGTLQPGGSQEFLGTIRDLRIWDQVMPIDANGDVVEASGSPSGGAVLRALRQKYMRERDERERADREFYARLEAGDEQ